MYYAEKTINGKLHYKNSPKGKWIEFTVEMLNKRIVDAEKALLDLYNERVESDKTPFSAVL